VPAGSDLGTIVRDRVQSYLRTHRTTAAQRKALTAIGACRTSAMGGHMEQCDHCGHKILRWHSCRNRGCPKCGGAARAAWLEQRRTELLPVPYFHVVFTVPEQFNQLALACPRVFYDLLFRAVGATLLDLGHSRLHVLLGALCVLHTWSQTLILHPHIHCVVPGGGFSDLHGRWVSVRNPKFFLPVKVLSRRFRTNLCVLLEQAFARGALRIDAQPFRLLIAEVRVREWVVYCKPPFAGPDRVLSYLANYTHRIAISDRRIVRYDGARVSFLYRDSRGGNATKTMSLDADEFLRRFLLHVIPRRFVRIRYYGFLANRIRGANVVRARAFLGDHPCTVVTLSPAQQSPSLCPVCQIGVLIIIELFSPESGSPPFEDSS